MITSHTLSKMQVCKKCKVNRPLSAYKSFKQNGKDYTTRTCQSCITQYQRDRISVTTALSQAEKMQRIREVCLTCGNVSRPSHQFHDRLRKGVLHSTMLAFSTNLDLQFPNSYSRKIKGLCKEVYLSYTADERKMIDRIKIAAWSRIEKEFPDEVNVPLVIATLFWEFPEIFGDKIKKWIDALEDKVIVLLPEEVTVKGRALTYRYAYLMETEIRNAR